MRGGRVLAQYGGRLLAEQRVARALVATQTVRRIPGRGQERQPWASGSGWGRSGSAGSASVSLRRAALTDSAAGWHRGPRRAAPARARALVGSRPIRAGRPHTAQSASLRQPPM